MFFIYLTLIYDFKSNPVELEAIRRKTAIQCRRPGSVASAGRASTSRAWKGQHGLHFFYISLKRLFWSYFVFSPTY